MVVKRKLDGAVDESSAGQEIRKSDAIVHNMWEIWRLHPAEPGLKAGKETKYGRGLTF